MILALVGEWIDRHPRRLLAGLSLACLGMLGYGLFLQHVVGLDPCPMCIVQRYALLLVGLVAAAGSSSARRGVQLGTAGLLVLLAGFGAFTAARQSWLQWYPPEVATCGRDFYGMIETFPLQRLVPMIFRGGGDCAKVDWTFMGGSLANWSFLVFCAIAVGSLALLWRRLRAR